jgi:hypothetical protein
MIKAFTCTWSVRLLFPGPFSPERSTLLALASTQYNFVTCIYGRYKKNFLFVDRHRLRTIGSGIPKIEEDSKEHRSRFKGTVA